MESIRVTNNGNMTLSQNIMQKMGIEKGGELFLCMQEGEYILKTTPANSIDAIRNLLEGEADRLGLFTEEDVVRFSKEIRSKRKQKHANNA